MTICDTHVDRRKYASHIYTCDKNEKSPFVSISHVWNIRRVTSYPRYMIDYNHQIDGSMYKRRNPIANAVELRFFRIKPSICKCSVMYISHSLPGPPFLTICLADTAFTWCCSICLLKWFISNRLNIILGWIKLSYFANYQVYFISRLNRRSVPQYHSTISSCLLRNSQDDDPFF